MLQLRFILCVLLVVPVGGLSAQDSVTGVLKPSPVPTRSEQQQDWLTKAGRSLPDIPRDFSSPDDNVIYPSSQWRSIPLQTQSNPFVVPGSGPVSTTPRYPTTTLKPVVTPTLSQQPSLLRMERRNLPRRLQPLQRSNRRRNTQLTTDGSSLFQTGENRVDETQSPTNQVLDSEGNVREPENKPVQKSPEQNPSVERSIIDAAPGTLPRTSNEASSQKRDTYPSPSDLPMPLPPSYQPIPTDSQLYGNSSGLTYPMELGQLGGEMTTHPGNQIDGIMTESEMVTVPYESYGTEISYPLDGRLFDRVRRHRGHRVRGHRTQPIQATPQPLPGPFHSPQGILPGKRLHGPRHARPFGNIFGANSSQWIEPGQMALKLDVQGIFLSHSGGDDEPFVFDNATGDVLFRHSDLTPDSDIGVKLGLLYQTPGGTGYEFSYFELPGFRNTETYEFATPVFFGGVPASPVDSYTTTYEAALKSYEFNAFSRRSNNWRVGIGFRAIDLDETFNTLETGTNDGFFSSTTNEMFGVQFNVDHYRPLSSTILLEASTRIGILHNDINVDVFELTRDFDYDNDTTSTNVDLKVGLAYYVTESLVTRIGYQAMFLNDVALAPNQSTGYSFFDTSAPANLGSLSLHGMYFGFSAGY